MGCSVLKGVPATVHKRGAGGGEGDGVGAEDDNSDLTVLWDHGEDRVRDLAGDGGGAGLELDRHLNLNQGSNPRFESYPSPSTWLGA